jgi:hypothetical protein
MIGFLGFLFVLFLVFLRYAIPTLCVHFAAGLVGYPLTWPQAFGVVFIAAALGGFFRGVTTVRVKALALAALLPLGMACATGTQFTTVTATQPDGVVTVTETKTNVSALGEGAMASTCDGESELVQIELDEETAAKLTPEQLKAFAAAQYPQGQCIAARGASISKELGKLLNTYLMSKGIGVIGDALGGMVGAEETEAAAEASATVIEAESEATVEVIGAEAAAAGN